MAEPSPRPVRRAAIHRAVRHRARTTVRALSLAALLSGAAGRSSAAEWEPVPPADLAATASTIDPSAGAELLFRKVSIQHDLTVDGPTSLREHHVRIKVYSEAAAQEHSLVRLTTSANGGLIYDVRGRTVLPDGSVLPLSGKSVSEAVAARRRHERIRRVSFAMPGVRPGCVIEYRYLEREGTSVELVTLQDELPARLIEYRIRPLRASGLHLQVTTFLTAATLGKRDPEGYYPVVVRNVPGFTEERHMPPASQLQPRLISYYTTEDKETPLRYWRSTSAKLAREFDSWTRANADMRALSAQLVAGASDDRARLRRIADWCRREVRVLRSTHPDSVKAHRAGSNFDARETFKRRDGSPMDLDRLFGALARAAGFDVRLLRVAVRGGMPFDQECMEIGFLPSWQIAVRIGARWESFDPQEPSLPWDMLRASEEGQLALFCDPDSAMFLETAVAPPGASVRSRSAELTLEPEGEVHGAVRVELSGHWNDALRDELEEAADSVKVFRELMDWDGDWIGLEHVRFEPGPDAWQPMRVTADVRLADHAALAGERILLEPAMWWAHREPELSAAQRRWPVLFDFAATERDSIRIHLPEGYTLDAFESPRPVHAAGVATFRATISAGGPGVLEFQRQFEMGQDGMLLFGTDSYSELKRMFELLHDRDRTTVTLSRAANSR